MNSGIGVEMLATPVTHKKTGNRYYMLKRDIIECTNGREEKKYVLYYRDGEFFCREQNEFNQKFESV